MKTPSIDKIIKKLTKGNIFPMYDISIKINLFGYTITFSRRTTVSLENKPIQVDYENCKYAFIKDNDVGNLGLETIIFYIYNKKDKKHLNKFLDELVSKYYINK